jgi:hypothetical protein
LPIGNPEALARVALLDVRCQSVAFKHYSANNFMLAFQSRLNSERNDQRSKACWIGWALLASAVFFAASIHSFGPTLAFADGHNPYDSLAVDSVLIALDALSDGTLCPCSDMIVNIEGNLRGATAFDLNLNYDTTVFRFLRADAPQDTALHVMPVHVDGDTVTIDGFLSQGSLGPRRLTSLHFFVRPSGISDSSVLRFAGGLSVSDSEGSIQTATLLGNAAMVQLTALPKNPLPIIITPYSSDGQFDSLVLSWPSSGIGKYEIFGSQDPHQIGTQLTMVSDTTWTDHYLANRGSLYFYTVVFSCSDLLKTTPPVWAYRRAIQILNTRAQDLTGYAVKIVLNSANFDFRHAQVNGQDLRFYDDRGELPLAYWIQDYDTTQQKAVVWVNVPQLRGHDATTIFVNYGNPFATDSADGNGTFLQFQNFNTNYDVVARASIADAQAMVEDTFPKFSEIVDSTSPYGGPQIREAGNVLYDPDAPDSTRRYLTWISRAANIYVNSALSMIVQVKSSDGLHWTETGLIDPTQGGEDPFVIKFRGRLWLYFEDKHAYSPDGQGNHDKVGYYTSDDYGTTWQYQGIAVDQDTIHYSCGDSPSSPTVWVEPGVTDTTLWMYAEYQHGGHHFDGMSCGNGIQGVLRSHDGIHWEFMGFIPLGTNRSLDSHCMVADCWVKDRGQLYLLYHCYGDNNTTWKLGIATTTNFTSIVRDSRSGNLQAFPWFDLQCFWDRDSTMRVVHMTYQSLKVAQFVKRDTTVVPANWTEEIGGTPYGWHFAHNGYLNLRGSSLIHSASGLRTSGRWTTDVALETRMKTAWDSQGPYTTITLGSGGSTNLNANGNWYFLTQASGYGIFLRPSSYGSSRLFKMPDAGSFVGLKDFNVPNSTMTGFNVHQLSYTGDTLRYVIADTLRAKQFSATYDVNPKAFMVATGEVSTWSGSSSQFDWIIIRKYVNPEPTASVGMETPAGGSFKR